MSLTFMWRIKRVIIKVQVPFLHLGKENCQIKKSRKYFGIVQDLGFVDIVTFGLVIYMIHYFEWCYASSMGFVQLMLTVSFTMYFFFNNYVSCLIENTILITHIVSLG